MRVRLPEGACSLGVGGDLLLPDAVGVCLVDDAHRDAVLLLGCVEVGEASTNEDGDEAPARRKRRVGGQSQL